MVGKVKETIQNAGDVWTRVRDVLDVALVPHPEARAAVLRAIEQEFVLREA